MEGRLTSDVCFAMIKKKKAGGTWSIFGFLNRQKR